MNCLNCGQEMFNHLVQTDRGEIAYDLCEGCGSLWLDKGELDKMAFEVEGSIELSTPEPAGGTGEASRTCPRCDGVRLGKARFLEHSDILLDRCGNCGGFWLDGGELDSVNTELTRIMPVKGRGFSDFVTKVHVPYWSKRIRVRSSETDFAVEVPVLKGAEEVGQTDMPCPRCGGKLNRYTLFGIEFEGCPACKGIFLGLEELRKLKDRLGRDLLTDLRWVDDEVDAAEKTPLAVSDRNCPRCAGQRLMTALFGDTRILLDYCPACRGVWLDANEFQEILAALRAKVGRMTTQEAARKVYQEIKEVWKGPEDVIAELLDAKAAIAALINIALFSHPALYGRLTRLGEHGRAIGLF